MQAWAPSRTQHGSLDWDDTLWWATARPGFSQIRAFSATVPGVYTVNCSDSLGCYRGEYLLADSADKGLLIGLGRTGSANYQATSVLAFAAVGALRPRPRNGQAGTQPRSG